MTRRGKGEGTIRKRTDRDGWEGMLTLPDGRRRSVWGRSRQEVQRKLAELRRTVEAGLPVASERTTVKQYLGEWLDNLKPPKLRRRTWARYEGEVRNHIVPAIGRLPLAKLSAAHIQRLVAQKQQEGLSVASVKHLHTVLGSALKAAVELGMLPRNVAALVKVARPQRTALRTLTEAEANQLMAAAEGERLGALWVLGMLTAMRAGELLGLRWGDIDLERGFLMLQRELEYVPHQGYVLSPPKTAKSVRRILLSETALEWLHAHRKRQLEERVAHADVWETGALEGLVFTDEIGGPLRGTHVLERQFYPFLARAGLPRISLRGLRHTAASLLLGRGVHPKVVQEMLGHTDISITMNIYSHLTPEMQQSAGEAMDQIFRKRRGDEDKNRDRGS